MGCGVSSRYSFVLPRVFSLAHDHDLSGHLGVNKTYTRILRHFFFALSKN